METNSRLIVCATFTAVAVMFLCAPSLHALKEGIADENSFVGSIVFAILAIAWRPA